MFSYPKLRNGQNVDRLSNKPRELAQDEMAAFLHDNQHGTNSLPLFHFLMQIQTILRELPILQMAYGASSVTLSDRGLYPYFMRTNPPDDIQAHFMVELLKIIADKGSTVDAVSIIYTDGLYGRTGYEVCLWVIQNK